MAKRVAVIDIGSNSVRMVVYEKTSRFAFHQLHEVKSKVRISENAYKDGGRLQEAPMQRTFDALHDFIQISRSYHVRKLLCIATSALRDAPNKKEFINKVKQKLQLNIKIISGEKEAYYGAVACINLLPVQKLALSIDIGGGSTELSYINAQKITDTISLKLGTVRLKELFFDNGDIKGAIKYIDKELKKIPDNKISTLVGIGGTFRAISTAIMKRSAHPLKKIHAYEYPVEKFSSFINSVLDANTKELSALGIKENRYDVIKPGTLILKRIIKKINITQIITSGVGVREGVYLSDFLRNCNHKLPHNFNTSVRYLVDAHIHETTYSNQIAFLSKKLFDLTQDYLELPIQYRTELAIAAKLHPIGSNVHFYSQNKHTYALIQTALEYGFTHKDITLIATLTKYSPLKLPAHSHMEKYASLLPSKKILKNLSYLLSLSIALLSHRPRNVDFTLEFKNGVLSVISQDSLYITKDMVSRLDYNHNEFEVRFYS